MNTLKKYKQGFTLIELLVVVLIIGILSAVALPQYTLAVEKSRATEALQNVRILEEQAKLYLLENGGTHGEDISILDFTSVELSGGNLNADGCYETKHFEYCPAVSNDSFAIEVYNLKHNYQFAVYGSLDNANHYCNKGCANEIGIKICRSLENFNWNSTDQCL